MLQVLLTIQTGVLHMFSVLSRLTLHTDNTHKREQSYSQVSQDNNAIFMMYTTYLL